MRINYEEINLLEYECSCVNIPMWKWEDLMEGAVRANKRVINALVKEVLPDLYESLALNFPNPYNYFRTKTHLILVHSSVEYFIRFS